MKEVISFPIRCKECGNLGPMKLSFNGEAEDYVWFCMKCGFRVLTAPRVEQVRDIDQGDDDGTNE